MRKKSMHNYNSLKEMPKDSWKVLITVLIITSIATFIWHTNITKEGRATGLTEHAKGDANTDGKIDEKDLEIFLNLKDKKTELPQDICTVDINNDGVFNETDYDLFLNEVFIGEKVLGIC